MKELVYVLIFIILLVVCLLIVLVIKRKDIFYKVHKGYTRVEHRDFQRKIKIKVSETDLKRDYMRRLAQEAEDLDSEFCKEQHLCKKYCHDDVCDDYQDKKITYDYCKDCEKNGLCWNELNGACEKCKVNEESCSEKFGCNGGDVRNPGRNYCKRCWKSE